MHEQFLADIVARPDDDTPRLIYADWLKEHDDPMGDFIQLQVDLYNRTSINHKEDGTELPTWFTEQDKDDYRHMQHLFYNMHARGRFDICIEAANGLPGKWFYRPDLPKVRRGFIDTVQLAADAFLDYDQKLFALVPLQHLVLTSMPEISFDNTIDANAAYFTANDNYRMAFNLLELLDRGLWPASMYFAEKAILKRWPQLKSVSFLMPDALA